MANSLSIEPRSAALLIMDYQRTIVDSLTSDDSLIMRTATLAKVARTSRIQVIYVTVGFREGYPEVSSRNRSFDALKASGRFALGAQGSEVHPLVAPEAGDIIVTKHRVSAFAGTDLEMILRAHQIDTLIFAGISTSGVVLSTLRYAADSDYRLFVVHDCCADKDLEVHRVLTEKVFPRQSTVLSAEELSGVIS